VEREGLRKEDRMGCEFSGEWGQRGGGVRWGGGRGRGKMGRERRVGGQEEGCSGGGGEGGRMMLWRV